MGLIEVRLIDIEEEKEAGHCYRMIFEDMGGTFQLPVIISYLDARPLMSLVKGEPARTGPHELLSVFMEKTGFAVSRVEIAGMERGIYKCRLVLDNFERTMALDSRLSDAVALALRQKAPIYAEESVVKKVGTLLSSDLNHLKRPHQLRIMQERLDQLIREERYEEAVVVRDRIRRLETLSGKGHKSSENIT